MAKVPAEMRSLFKAAMAAGVASAEARVPVPMVVVERANPFDDASPVVRRYAPVMGGVCGFAWVHIKGVGRLANAAKALYGEGGLDSRNEYVGVHKAYGGGLDIWVRAFGQSMEKKESFARGFAKVLSDAGHMAYADSRMD